MDTQKADALPEWAKLRRTLRAQARSVLEQVAPTYMTVFNQELKRTADLEAAGAAARAASHGLPKEWSRLLELLFDLEQGRDMCKRAISLLKTKHPPDGAWNSGAWTWYNTEAWAIHSYAYLERLDALVKKVCRVVIKPNNKDWQTIEEKLSAVVSPTKARVKKLRDPMVHTGEGGASAGITAEKLWELSLLVGFDQDIAPYVYRSAEASGAQKRRNQQLKEATARMLAASEAIFGELNRNVDGPKA